MAGKKKSPAGSGGASKPKAPPSRLNGWVALTAAGCLLAAFIAQRLFGGAGAAGPQPKPEEAAKPAAKEEAAAPPPVALPELGPAALWASGDQTLGGQPLSRSVQCVRRKSDAEANKCMPAEDCTRHVIDGLATDEEVRVLRELIGWLVAEAWGAGAGPPSVVDLHQGSISYKERFVLLHKLMEFKQVNFTAEQISTYNAVRDRAHERVRELFGAPEILPEMAFFSHINASKAPRNVHDEYWHPHIDTEQYGTFAVTTILYLNNLGTDYSGGAFRFADDKTAAAEALGGAPGGKWSSVEPAAGRMVAFTSGRENVHRVEPVSAGVRLALTMAFTCSEGKAAAVPRWEGGGGAMLAEAEAEAEA